MKFRPKRQTVLLILIVIAAASIGLFVLPLIGVTLCPFRMFLHIPCPGCGMTRACVSAMHLDFHSAFAFHPLWPIVPLFTGLIILYSADKRMTRARRIIYEATLWAFCGGFIVTWIVRMVWFGWRG